MSFSTIETNVASAVATNGTFTVNYPGGQSQALYTGAVNHRIYTMGAEYRAPTDFTVAFGTTNITITWLALTTIPAGQMVRINIDKLGFDAKSLASLNSRILPAPLVLLDLGAPLTAAANGLALSQSVAANGAFILNGARAVNSVGIMDVPRNVVAAWTGTAILTIRGFDVDNMPVTEVSASGTAHTGTKCFASVNSITSSAAITAATAGFGLSIGLPARVFSATSVLYEVKNGVLGTVGGTLTVGVTTAATGTSGDTRGRYVTSVAPDGLTSYALLTMMVAPDDRGVPQYVA